MPENFPWALFLLNFLSWIFARLFSLFRSSDPSAAKPMETEDAGEENARGNNDDAAATEEEAAADDPTSE